MGCGDQFILLLWKNFILQKRRYIATVIELILPIFFSVILVIIRMNVEVEVFPNITTFEPFVVDNLPKYSRNILPDDQTWTIAYVPTNVSTINEIMLAMQKRLNANSSNSSQNSGQLPTNPLNLCNFSVIPAPSFPASINTTSAPSPQTAANSSRAIAENTYRGFQLPVQAIIDEMAVAANVSSTDLLFGVLQNGSWDSFIANLTRVCQQRVFRQLGITAIDAERILNASRADASNISSFVPVVPKVRLLPFEDEEAFLEHVRNDTNLERILAGVIFSGFPGESGTIPDNLNITFRFHSDPITTNVRRSSAFSGIVDTWRTYQLFPTFQRLGPRSNNSNTGGRPYYYEEGFLSLMHAVHLAFASVLTNSTEDESTFELKSIVQEKELRMKEYMMMMGLSNWLHWSAWFFKYLLFLMISCIMMTFTYKIEVHNRMYALVKLTSQKIPQRGYDCKLVSYGSTLPNSDPFVIFFFLLIFSAATITLSFLISTFFSKANVAAAAGGTIYAFTYMPYLFMSSDYASFGKHIKIISSFLSNVAMAGGLNIIGRFEGKGTGVQWSNLHQGVTVDDNFTMLHIFGMLILDTILYMLLSIYIEGVWPGEYGVPKPWYFPFMKSYWQGFNVVGKRYSIVEDVEKAEEEASKRQMDKEYFEDEPNNLKRTVEIRGLRKVFNDGGKRKVAVDNLHLNMYDGQITVLLGHNGAGKTTTMSMLTGFFPPSGGDAFVDGHSVTKDIIGVRKALGLCPQFNILFDLLTVDEHLYFFGRLKGLSKEQAKAECKEMTKVLKLEDKRNRQSHTLSGGMKRKLSVGLALCAGSKYVIMDEPTSGMDPAARRAIWEVLQFYRNKCSMLLSTHFMDEADLLGDRIAIMADGKLRCSGSSLFLKSVFGVGYHIVLTQSSGCDVNKLTELIQSFVPESGLERTAGAELSYVLPFQASPKFPGLFQALDDNAASLGIAGYGATITTLEEVFLRVTEDSQVAVKSASERWMKSKTSVIHPVIKDGHAVAPVNPSTFSHSEGMSAHAKKESLHTSFALNTGVTLWIQQFRGLLVKKILHSRRNYKVAIFQLLVPIFFSVLAILNAKFPPFERTNDPLGLTIDAYGPNTVYIDNPHGLELGEVYRDQFSDLIDRRSYSEGDFETFLSDENVRQGGEFNTGNIISASFRNTTSNKSHTTAWFNNQGFHTPATSLAHVDQAYVRHVTKRNFSIRVINSPLPRNSTKRVEEQLLGSFVAFLMAFNIVLGFSFLAASFCLFVVRERVERSSLLQTLAGVDPLCFWLSAFVWDFVNFMIPCVLTVVMFAAFSVTEFTHHSGVVLLLFALYCWSTLPLTYLLSLLFTVPSTALVRITIANVIIGVASIITVNVLRILNMTDVADGLNWGFLIIPPYCLGMGLADLYSNHKMVNICTTSEVMKLFCEDLGITFQENFLAWDQFGVGKFVIFMILQGLVFLTILFLIEFNVYTFVFRLSTFSKAAVDVQDEIYDDDVAKESVRINSSELSELVKTDRLILKNLRKIYGSGDNALIAVHHLSIGIPEGECFGLLGINGAGKTTTFKMLTGDYSSTSGTAYLDGYDVKSHLRQAQQRMGYCPQFDALIEQMTGSETIRMFARLRGVPESSIPACIENLGNSLHFSQHLDKQCGKYSGGNKRKLSTAIALVGNPPVVLLDEPSTGMDPGARRMLWDALTSVRASGRSIVISSHSMEECEALCTRLSIMVNGTLRCIGGTQHLKSKFGQGYTVDVKAKDADVKTNLKKYLPGCELKDENQGLLTFYVPQFQEDTSELNLSALFQSMEDAKGALDFGDYTVTQTTLEQVFLQLVRRQMVDDAKTSQ